MFNGIVVWALPVGVALQGCGVKWCRGFALRGTGV